MKVLWLCNIVLPCIAEDIGLKPSVFGGWLVDTSNSLVESENIELHVVFINSKTINKCHGRANKIFYYGVSDRVEKNSSKSNEMEEILRKVQPDVIHIWGTEFLHTWAMVQAAEKTNMINKLVISIQGLISVCSERYGIGLPYAVTYRHSLRDFLRQSSIKDVIRKFKRRGEFEISAICESKHVIGRTVWDYSHVKSINKDICYHLCNETLRAGFYNHKWNIKGCEKYCIFTNESSNPIKGFHILLKAVYMVKRQYPMVRIRTTGQSWMKPVGVNKFKLSYYQKYLKRLTKAYGLEDNIEFTGYLDEQQMIDEYINAHVFVSASSIENSSNSIGEAMLMGVPTIASNVGGTDSLLKHNEDGYLYPFEEAEMLAYYIIHLFEHPDVTERISMNAINHARETHDSRKNLKNLLSIYNQLNED